MKTTNLLISLILLTALLVGCSSGARVGELRSESHLVDLGGAKSVYVNINLGAGDLVVAGGAEKLLEADFTYNVAKLKPEVEYLNGALVVQQPEVDGLPVLQGISDFRNEWNLSLANQVPMNLKVEMGAGAGDLKLTGLSLTGLDVSLGAGEYRIDLSGDWARDLNATIDTGAADVTVRLPRDVGVRVSVDRGPTMIKSSDLKQDGDVYTNAAYGISEVTLQLNIRAGIGLLDLELVDH